MAFGSPYFGGNAVSASPEPQVAQAATQVITGVVTDEKGEPVIGASVIEPGTTRGTVTDIDGKFSLRLSRNGKVRISYVGCKTQEMKAADNLKIVLQEDKALLDEVVVVGFGSQKRANLTGAVSTVDVAKTVESRPLGDVTKALQGAVPGVTITASDGAINAQPQIKIRGTGTLSNGQTSNPLIIVDGVPTDDISFVNPEDIAEMSVLKDAASASIYGTRAAFGVILITTKSGKQAERVSVKYTNNFSWSQATVLPDYASVPDQIRAYIQTNNRHGADSELFGMYLDKMLPYAEAWYTQNGGKKKGYSEMKPFESWDNVGDFYQDPTTGATMYYADWDVKNIMFNNAAPSQKHNVSIDGNTGKTAYRVSAGYDSREGLMSFTNETMRRYNASASLSTEIFPWLRAGANVNFSQKKYDGKNLWGRGGYTYIWRWGSFFGPYGYRLADDGKMYDHQPIADRKQSGTNTDIARDLRLQAYLDATITKGLILHADFTYDVTSINNQLSYLPIYGWNNWSNATKAPEYMVKQNQTYAQQSNTRQDKWNTDVYATYELNLNDAHNFKIMAGTQIDRQEYNYFSARVNELGDNDKPFLGLATGGAEGTGKTITNTITHHATAGFFGRINYDYKGIYLLELNGRYDSSSSFPADKQWAFFPSASVGYRFSEEAYFTPLKKYINNAKLRLSYGQVGNEAIGDYMFLERISKNTYAASNVNGPHWVNAGGSVVTMLNTPSLVSSSLTWERISNINAGLDLSFLNNSLNVTFDWFQRDTKDMLAPGMTLPSVLGASAPYANTGQLRTRGWELGISWNQKFGDVNVWASANVYDGKTKVVKYNNANKLISNFYDGMEYGEIWGFETDRYFEESDFNGKDENGNWIYKAGVASQTTLESGSFKYGPGDIKFKDLNGDGVINGGDPNMKDENGNLIPVSSVRNHGDLKVIGNATPRYEYSFHLGASWKGIDIDLFFQGVGKRKYWSPNAFTMPFARGADATYAHQNSYNKMIFDENRQIVGYEIDQSNDYPCMYDGFASSGKIGGLLSGQYNFYPQTKYLLNMAYLRMKNITVGYTLPSEITKKALIQKARIYFSTENPFLIYNGLGKNPIDPEIGSKWTTSTAYSNGTFGRTDPVMRSYSFGMQVTF